MNKKTIELRNLCFTYPDGTQALRGISFRVGYGESVAIVGGNGAGKSTLLQHLNGFLTPAAGAVLVDGQPITRETIALVRRFVGIVFQDPDDQLFMPTVFDDIAFGPLNAKLPPEEVERRVTAALERVGMQYLRDRPPYKLSAGEKRAVAIASVLAAEPDILVMDEPSSNLDPRARRRLMNLLNGFEQTRIIATHDLEMVVEICQRVIVLDHGVVVAEGCPADVFMDEEKMLRNGLECPHILRHRHPH